MRSIFVWPRRLLSVYLWDWRARMTAFPKGLPLNYAYFNLQNVDSSWNEIDFRFEVARNQDEVILRTILQYSTRLCPDPCAGALCSQRRLLPLFDCHQPQQMQYMFCRKHIFGVCHCAGQGHIISFFRFKGVAVNIHGILFTVTLQDSQSQWVCDVLPKDFDLRVMSFWCACTTATGWGMEPWLRPRGEFQVTGKIRWLVCSLPILPSGLPGIFRPLSGI